jgi:hypothetical protein
MARRKTEAANTAPRGNTPAEPHVPSDREAEALAVGEVRRRACRPAPPLKTVLQDDGVRQIEVDDKDPGTGAMLLMEALGTGDHDFFTGLVTQLAAICQTGDSIDDGKLNHLLSMILSVKPDDEIETMLASQMAALHMASLVYAERVMRGTYLDQLEHHMKALTKLTRAYATQLEALRKYRSGGEQKITVQHVTVNDGGQAIVGDVTANGRGLGKKPDSTR